MISNRDYLPCSFTTVNFYFLSISLEMEGTCTHILTFHTGLQSNTGYLVSSYKTDNQLQCCITDSQKPPTTRQHSHSVASETAIKGDNIMSTKSCSVSVTHAHSPTIAVANGMVGLSALLCPKLPLTSLLPPSTHGAQRAWAARRGRLSGGYEFISICCTRY